MGVEGGRGAGTAGRWVGELEDGYGVLLADIGKFNRVDEIAENDRRAQGVQLRLV